MTFSRLLLSLALLFSAATAQTRADFSGPYAVPEGWQLQLRSAPPVTQAGTWTVLTSGSHVETYLKAYVYTTANHLNFYTGISAEHRSANALYVGFGNTIAAAGSLSFDYSITLQAPQLAPNVNYAGFSLNGVLSILPAGTGSVTFPVSEADQFSFNVYAGGNCIGCNPSYAGGASMTITNFNAPIPEPATVALLILACTPFAMRRCLRLRNGRALFRRS